MSWFRYSALFLVLLIVGCSHVGGRSPDTIDESVAQAELDALRDQLELARQLAESGNYPNAAQAYRIALELLPSEEFSPEIQAELDELATVLLDEYHLLLNDMPALPGETPAWAVVAEIDSTVDGDTTTVVEVSPPEVETYDMPLVMNSKVERVIEYFTGKGREPFSIWLERAGRFEPLMREILREHELPGDLIYLSMIESGFNPKAYSYAHAAGPWQFISGTGRKFGLRIDWWVDERRDFVKSTHAACSYLKMLYNEFQSWELALAAYNCGEGRVARHIRQYNTRDFWRLSRLPRQTRNYVPTFMGAMVIAKDPESYGFFVVPQPPLEWETVELNECTSLDIVARCAGTSMEELQLLNPELRRGCTPPDAASYEIRLPIGTSDTFLAEFKDIPDSEKITWARHIVQRGQTLSGIAGRYGTSVRAIQDFNNLRGTLIREGASLLIPVPAAGSSGVPYQWASTGGEESSYYVRRGDTLGSISRRHGISLSQLCSWNGLNSRSIIYPGQRLKLWPGSGSAVPGGTYVVRRGDTLSRIASRYGTSIAELQRLNSISGSRIYVGQRLRLSESNEATIASTTSSTPTATYTVRPGDTLSEIAERHGMGLSVLRRLNRMSGSRIYVGQTLNVYSTETETIASTSSTNKDSASQHIVRRGDSLAVIANRYGVTVSEIRDLNNIKGSMIYPGQKLTLRTDSIDTPAPEAETVASTAPASVEEKEETITREYVVKSGDNLTDIASLYGMTVTELRNMNGIRGSRIYVGQKLLVLDGNTTQFSAESEYAEDTQSNPMEYVVRRGDTLNGIAQRYQMTLTELRRANGLTGSTIYPGQRLLVGGTAAETHKDGGTRPATYVVRRGDNLYVIARKFGLTIAELTKWNGMRSTDTLYPGTKLNLIASDARDDVAIGG